MQRKVCSPPRVTPRSQTVITHHKMGGAAANHSAMENLTPLSREAPAQAANPTETCKALSLLPVWEVFQLQMQKHLLRSM